MNVLSRKENVTVLDYRFTYFYSKVSLNLRMLSMKENCLSWRAKKKTKLFKSVYTGTLIYNCNLLGQFIHATTMYQQHLQQSSNLSQAGRSPWLQKNLAYFFGYLNQGLENKNHFSHYRQLKLLAGSRSKYGFQVFMRVL